MEEIQDYLEESDFSKKAFEKCPKYETLERLDKKMRKARKLLK
jgi:hypothetical protein